MDRVSPLHPQPKPRRCASCARQHTTGMVFVRPLCPPCWIKRALTNRPPRQNSPQFGPKTTLEHLVDDWVSYYSLLSECMKVRRQEGATSFDQLSRDEQALYALSTFDSLVSEYGFPEYFDQYYRNHLPHLERGFALIDAPEHIRLFREAERLFLGQTPAEFVQAVEGYRHTGDSRYHELSRAYVDLEEMVENIAVAAWQAGLIVEKSAVRAPIIEH